MKIEILYFAYLREQLGFDREEAETPDDVRTVGALRDWLDVVAFFPPVTGG